MLAVATSVKPPAPARLNRLVKQTDNLELPHDKFMRHNYKRKKNMNKLKLIIIVLFLGILNFSVYGQENPIDQFKIEDYTIDVYFYDPLETLTKLEDFRTMSDKSKSSTLDYYLHNHALYLFLLTDSKTTEKTYLCIRGNPEKLKTKMFYKVEIIKGITSSSFNPNTDNYSDKIVNVIDDVNCGGTLFESMTIFSQPKNKDKVGNGIQLYGYFRRVQPYSEIKDSMKEIIKSILTIK
jgi:hypothetical protein